MGRGGAEEDEERAKQPQDIRHSNKFSSVDSHGRPGILTLNSHLNSMMDGKPCLRILK